MIPDTSTNHLLDLAFTTGTYKGRGMKLRTSSSSLKTTDETCRPSQVSSGRPGIGQKHVWLMVLHFKLRNGVFPHLHFLWLKDHALPIVEWAGNSSQALVSDISCGNKQLRNEQIIVALLFSRAEIILFSTESSSWTEVRQLLSEGPSLKSWQCLGNDDSFPNDPRLEIQNWNPQKEHKRAHNLMPSFMKGLLSRQCIVQVLRCPLEDRALGKNTPD